MFDRYDPREEDGRSRGNSFERHRGLRGSSDRDDDGRSAFGHHVDLPRGPDRELVRDRKRSYELNGQEREALPTIGAFRVVHADDLRDVFERERERRPARLGVEFQVPQAVRQAQHPLPHGHVGEHVIEQVGSALGHPAATATWTNRPRLARKRDQPVEAAVVAAKPREPAREAATP